MARRDQPYLPLYVQDFMSDEKLRNCSAESVGVYIYTMCFFHKAKDYGSITLEERQKKSADNIKNFACVLLRQLPFELLEIERGLTQLVEEGVLIVEGDTLYQKRMVKDGELSEKRAIAGASGGLATQNARKVAKAKSEQKSSKKSAKIEQNTENEIESEIEYEIDNKKSNKGKSLIPTLEDVQEYVKQKGYSVDPLQFYNYFTEGKWIDSKGNPVKNWKQKLYTWETYNKQNGKGGSQVSRSSAKKSEDYRGEDFFDT